MDIFTSQGDLLLQTTQCMYAANAFMEAAPLFPLNPTLIALYEATTCPSALNVSDTEYASLFKNKIAIWLR